MQEHNAQRMLIGGAWAAARSGRTYDSIDPYTQTAWATVPDAGPEDVDDAVAAARDALERGPWHDATGAQRAALMRELARLVECSAGVLAEYETRDNGKLLREMRGQMAALPAWLHYYAGLADKLHGEAIPTDKPNFFAYTRREPVGVVAAIIPWNSPLLLLLWKLAPALAAGCTLVVKPSDHAPVSTLRFAALMAEAGFPPGVLNVVTGQGPATGRALTAHAGVDKIAFTGSTEVGADVGRAAMANMTRVSLELGGKSAQVVFADADLDAAANGVVAGVFAAAGQTCMAGSRLLVEASVHDALVERVVGRLRRIVVGDPRDEATELGPLANGPQFERVVGHLRAAREEGATVAFGGGADGRRGGWFVEPTVLVDCAPEMAAVREEIFGPVLAVMRFSDEQEAVALANDSRYGLAGSVWTADVHRAHRVAHRLRAGTVWINAYRTVGPGVPFGGFELSGLGRENGVDAVLDYTETKAVWVELSGETRDPFTLG